MPRFYSLRNYICTTAIIVGVLTLSACVSTRQSSSLTVIVVRHAEKMISTDADPALSADGAKRAEALAEVLRNYPLVGIYSTDFTRTRTTAAPTALQFKLPVQIYDAKKAAPEFVQQLRAQYTKGAVLVIGHSNTVPQIASALCDCTVAPLQDSDYGDRFEIRLRAGTPAELLRSKF